MSDVAAKQAKTYPASKIWFERAKKSLAGGVSSQFRMFGGPHPMFYERAEGAYLWDADGNKLLDFTLAQGPMILGHSHPELLSAVNDALAKGQLFAGQHEQEVLLAEKLQAVLPSAERVRFSSSGSEADQTVLRLARFVTRKPKFIKFEGQYHGWFDNVSFNVNPKVDQLGAREQPEMVPWGGGIPEDEDSLIPIPWNDLELITRVVEARHHEIGAIITEPVMCNQGCIEPAPGYLQGLRNLCDQYDIALVFDEIITGFRLDLGGAQTYYGVTPDLSLFGKAMACGFPISAIVGTERFMRPLETSEVYHAGTLNGNNACVAAALKTIELLEADDRKALQHVFELGCLLRDGLKEIAETSAVSMRVTGPGPMVHVGFGGAAQVNEYRDLQADDSAHYGEFCERMLAHNIRLIGRGLWYVSAAHTEDDIECGLATVRSVLAEMSLVAS